MAVHLPGIEGIERVRRGGFATVYRGWQPAFQRWVAIKVLDQGPFAPKGSRFEKEVRALGALSGHPHVVAVYAAGTLDDEGSPGRPYLVMPWLSGGSLDDRLAAGPVEPGDVVSTGIAIADALVAAHRLGLLHRDVKPANILYTAYGVPQLADFGIARFSDSTVTNGPWAGTVAYTAPEVLAGQRSTPASDVYSLGASLHAALRGAPPFAPGDDESLIAFAVRTTGEVPPSLTEAGVAQPLVAVVNRAMAKNPAYRYPTAEALREALGQVSLPGGPVSRVEETATASEGTGARHRRGRPMLVGAVVTLAVLAGAGTGAGLLAADHRAGRQAVRHPAPGATTTAPPATSTGRQAVGHQAPGATTKAPPATSATTSVPATTPPSSAASPPTSTAPATSPPPPATSPPPPATSPPPPAGANEGAAGSTSTNLPQLVDRYYALVSAHQLGQSFTWLSPAYRQRLGYAYYQQFWSAIRSVTVLGVTPGDNQAEVTLRFAENNGTVSVERTELTFVPNPAGGLYIDTYRVLSSG